MDNDSNSENLLVIIVSIKLSTICTVLLQIEFW